MGEWVGVCLAVAVGGGNGDGVLSMNQDTVVSSLPI